MKEKLGNESKGITLIALVITIIVLLILAAVIISTLTGDNGILTQANIAKTKNKNAEAEEQVKLAIMGSYGEDGKIDLDQLNKNLSNIEGLKYKDGSLSDTNKIESLPATITLNAYNIQINKNGEVKELPEIIAQIIANPQAYYGKKVKNYKVSDSDTNTYRIFYVDKENYFKDGENTIYLKADYSGSEICSTEYDLEQTKVREMNPLWAEHRGTSESNWNENEKASAWACSPVDEKNYENTSLLWKKYYNSEYANYVIGGPSIEMYIKSYNYAYKEITDINTYTLGVNYEDTPVPGYTYTLNGKQSTISNSGYSTGSYSLDCTKYNSMYCGKNGNNTGFWLLASPLSENSYRMCFVYGPSAALDRRMYNSSNKFRYISTNFSKI